MEKGYTMMQAMAEAARCLLCHDAPCSVGCSAGTEPDRFIRKLRFKNLRGAYTVIKENNILGGVCAVVCPTCDLCGQGCTAQGLDRPIEIGRIQRFIVEHGHEMGWALPGPGDSTGKKVAIVGAGPSGLAAAAELAKAGVAVTVFETRAEPGGMLRYGIPAHRLSADLMARDVADVTALGVEIRCGSKVDDLAALKADFDAVYVATGTWRSLPLGVPNRDSQDVIDAISFLVGAREDEARFADKVRGRTVAVIGGGDTAMDAAVSAAKHGAADVYLVYRRSFVEMPCADQEKDAAVREGVHFLVLTQPVDYLIEDGAVKGMKVVRCKLGEPDLSGRRRPVAMDGSEHPLEVDMIVEAIGLAPTEDVRKLDGLNLDKGDLIQLSDPLALKAADGVYAGGDAIRGTSLVVHAVADGKRAALAILLDLGISTTGGQND